MDIFLNIFLPIIIIGAFAAVFAFCLSYLGDRMKVERDEKAERIEKLLSGANCGGCGYAGCSQFAEALAKGEETVDKCNPTSSGNKKAIGEILGVEVDANPTVAVIHCAGGERASNKFEYIGLRDCRAAAQTAGGQKACEFGCLGFGTCVSVCQYDSARIGEFGAAFIDKAKCTSCGKCIAECPRGIIGQIPASASVYVACSSKCKGRDVVAACKAGCIACGKCEKSCPAGAIKVIDNVATVDYSLCTGCKTCVTVCPRKIIIEH